MRVKIRLERDDGSLLQEDVIYPGVTSHYQRFPDPVRSEDESYYYYGYRFIPLGEEEPKS